MKKPKLISLWINPNNSSTLNTCEIEFNGITMKIELNKEQVSLITNLIYTHIGDTIMKAFSEKINPTLASDEEGFTGNPFILSK